MAGRAAAMIWRERVAVLFAAMSLSVTSGAIGYSMRPEHVVELTCRDFHSQHVAQAAYEDGQGWLDGDGDGIACEGLDE